MLSEPSPQTRLKVSNDITVAGEEHYKLLYLARLHEVKVLHRALNKRARKIQGMRKRIERLEARTR